MSGPATLSPSPPRRGVRRLNLLPGLLGGGFVILVTVVVAYTLFHFEDQKRSEEAAPSAQFPSSADDVLAKAPEGELIPYMQPTPVALPPPAAPARAYPTPAAPVSPVDPEMTAMAIEARRKAWQSYYQQLIERQDKRRKDLIAALSSPAAIGQASAGSDAAGHSDTDFVPRMPAFPGRSGGDEPPSVAQHQQSFLAGNGSSPDTDYSPFTVTAPISRYELKAGDVITGRMVSGLDSDGPGTIKAVVSQNVYDHATGTHILIPQGSTLVGVYDNAVAYGQSRVVVGWQRIIYPPPGSESLDLGRIPGSDQSGFAGFEDQTDNHYYQIFTNAILLSLFSAGTQLSQPQSRGEYYGPGQTVASSIGQQLGQLGQEFARRGLDIPPTNRIRNGYPFTIMLTRDIAFPRPWQPAAGPGQSRMAVRHVQ